ncbi:MAG: glycosyltransferase [Lachnospiraceae bacterium]|nr:glycosyltransferase [Lachnospiraceae bacterium]
MAYQTYNDGYIKSNIKLSIGMLVSNHIQYIEKCMEGLKPLLEAVPSELIILDTVGPENSDGSIEVCRKYTDKIYRFEWVNDFSAARNELLKHSNGEWFMYQDDDEWFDDVNEFVHFFNSKEMYKYNSGFYQTHDAHMDGSVSVAIAGRMIRRRPDTHFVGRVHETFNEANVPGKEFSAFTHHKGYLYNSPEDKNKKSMRNISLLEAEMKETGLVPGRCAQLVQEYMNIPERQEEGYRLNLEYVDKLVEAGLGHSNCTQWMLVAQPRYFLIKGDGEAIIKRVAEIRNKYKLSHYAALAIAEIEVEGVTNYGDSSKYLELILEDVKTYFEMDEYLSNHPNERLVETQLDLPRFYTDERKNAMRIAGAQACNYLNKFELAYKYWSDVDWTILDNPSRYKDVLRYTFQNLEDTEPLTAYYRHFMNECIFEEGNEKYLPSDLLKVLNKNVVPVTVEKTEQKEPEEKIKIETYGSGFVKSDIILSIGILVSNNIEYVEKGMKALKPLLDAVPSELIVVDTVGPEKSDGSIEICKQYTDKIYRFEWINDFSAARNELIKHSRGEWFMFQDDDEWFENVTELIDFFKSDKVHKFNAATYYVKNYTMDGSYSMAMPVRMVRRKPDTHFEGKIHETFNEAHLPAYAFQSYVHHAGYRFKTPEERAAKSLRNMTLLEAEIRESGINPHRCAQMVQELMNIPKRCDEGYRLGKQYVEELVKMGEERDNCTQWCICAQARYFLLKKDAAGMAERVKEIRETYNLTHFARLVLAEVEVDTITHYSDMSDYIELIEKDVEEYFEMERFFEENPDAKLMESQMDFPRFRSDACKNAMKTAGAQVCNHLEKYEKAFEYWKGIDWSIFAEPARCKGPILYTLKGLPDATEIKLFYQRFLNPDLFEAGMEKYLPKDLREKL